MNRDTNIFILSYIIQNEIDKKEVDIYKLNRDYFRFLDIYEPLTNGGQNKIKIIRLGLDIKMTILKNNFKDVENYLVKFIKLINIIEENICNNDGSIEREILINLDIGKKGVRNLFNKFYLSDISLCKYINERQRSLVMKEIENINDCTLIEMTIKRIINIL